MTKPEVKQHPRTQYVREYRKRVGSKVYQEWNNKWRAKNPELVADIRLVCEQNRRPLAQGRITTAEWLALKKQYGNKCLCCGVSEREKRLTMDHIIPFSKGGLHTIDNVQPLCRSCNAKKHVGTTNFRNLYGKQSSTL